MKPFRLALTALALSAALCAPARSDNLGRLIDISVLEGWQTDQGSRMAALQITLREGWKTYWRMPGDSGIPPSFSWDGSENLRAVQLHWPRPTVFHEDGLETIGYKKELILPVEIFPRDAAAPVRLAGTASVGVCREVCVPVDAAFGADLALSAAMTADAEAPIRGALNSAPHALDGPRTVACAVEPIADGLRLTARIDVPDQGGAERVVFETGRPELWISQPESRRDGTYLVAAADLVPPEARPFAFDRSDLRVTVLGDARAVEMRGCSAF